MIPQTTALKPLLDLLKPCQDENQHKDHFVNGTWKQQSRGRSITNGGSKQSINTTRRLTAATLTTNSLFTKKAHWHHFHIVQEPQQNANERTILTIEDNRMVTMCVKNHVNYHY